MSAVSHFDYGKVVFTPAADGMTRIKINVCNGWLGDGARGFHIHESGDMSDGCKSMGAHYNPDDKKHGGLSDEERHFGDFGNVPARNGCIVHELQIPNMKLNDIVGRGLVIHERADDLGRGGDKESEKTGNAGGRLLCAPIVWSS